MIADIKNVIPHIQDSDMVELSKQVLEKLEVMSDAEFAKVHWKRRSNQRKTFIALFDRICYNSFQSD